MHLLCRIIYSLKRHRAVAIVHCFQLLSQLGPTLIKLCPFLPFSPKPTMAVIMKQLVPHFCSGGSARSLPQLRPFYLAKRSCEELCACVCVRVSVNIYIRRVIKKEKAFLCTDQKKQDSTWPNFPCKSVRTGRKIFFSLSLFFAFSNFSIFFVLCMFFHSCWVCKLNLSNCHTLCSSKSNLAIFKYFMATTFGNILHALYLFIFTKVIIFF